MVVNTLGTPRMTNLLRFVYRWGDTLKVTEQRGDVSHTVTVPYSRHPDPDAESVAIHLLDVEFRKGGNPP